MHFKFMAMESPLQLRYKTFHHPKISFMPLCGHPAPAISEATTEVSPARRDVSEIHAHHCTREFVPVADEFH